MTFNNYKIPENITAEDEFMYNLMDRLHSADSSYGFLMGSFHTLIEHLKENDISNKLIKEAEDIKEYLETYLQQYDEIYDFSCERWKALGKPLSLAEHQERKKQLDAEDNYRAKYCDR